MARVLVAPSILSADFGRLAEEVEREVGAGEPNLEAPGEVRPAGTRTGGL